MWWWNGSYFKEPVDHEKEDINTTMLGCDVQETLPGVSGEPDQQPLHRPRPSV